MRAAASLGPLLLAASLAAGCAAAPDALAPQPVPEVDPGARETDPDASIAALADDPTGTAAGEVAPGGDPNDGAGSANGSAGGDGSGDDPADPPGAAPDDGAVVQRPGIADGEAVQLTTGGCCVQPLWRADGGALWFIDRPEGGETGIYEARLDAPGAPPALLTTTIASFSPDQRWRMDRATGRTTLVRLSDGAAFDVPAGGRTVAFSPDGARIAWQTDIPGAQPERNVATVFVGTPDGAERREVARLTRGSLAGWLDGETLLVRGREAAQAEEDVVWAQPLDGGERREIARARRMRGQVLSPGGRWLIWYVAGDPTAEANGLWLAETRAGAPAPRRLEGRFGAYQWRDARRLVMVPFDLGAPSHRLVELDVETGAERPLTDPSTLPLRIANGDWSVSPDGRHMAYVSAADQNLWVVRLPD